MSLVSSVLGDLAEGFSLPITRRGLFSQDDFFQGFQKDYSSAVEDVLNRWGSRASKADRFASYKRLRERDASDDSKAATISETEGAYVIVIDMSDFANGEITVQTVQCSAVVEGKYGDRTYKRSFPLPNNTVIDGVKADLSDDNILTVTAPRKGRAVAIGTSDSTGSASTGTSQAGVSSIEAQIIPTECQSSLSSSCTTTKGRPIPMTLEGESAVASTAAQVVKNEALSTERRSSQSRIIPLNIEGETSSTTSAATTTETTKEVSERIIPTAVQEQQGYRTMTSSYQNRVLPINKRGRFFQDAAFENVWRDFETAIDELVTRRGSRAGMEDDRDQFQSYRNLRDIVQQDDNQAATVSKENNECKIVVDVKDFVDGHLDVKAIEGVIIVSGKKGHYTFEKRFTVASLKQPDKVTAAISADGVLTITAPLF
ncbi:uncharacterized protein LOC135222867 [Macrobrachium nipponense]|uniref:uncharacterized protein LOC135222867 n=1 Tax=Macrobrachium nipponense TaxID=159736 RepID=UPI0030C848F7